MLAPVKLLLFTLFLFQNPVPEFNPETTTDRMTPRLELPPSIPLMFDSTLRDINRVKYFSLQEVEGMTEEAAAIIIIERDKNGPYKSAADAKARLPQEIFERFKDKLYIVYVVETRPSRPVRQTNRSSVQVLSANLSIVRGELIGEEKDPSAPVLPLWLPSSR